MYAFVKGKPAYVKEDTAKARVRPINSDTRKNIGFQVTNERETQENKEKIKDKNTQYPQKGDLPRESQILLQGKSLYG
jgi:hypothetical protein